MLFRLSALSSHYSFFNLFRYITFRSVAALFTSFFLVFFLAPPFIRWIRQKGSQPIRLDGPESHLATKKGTPTMGGALILGSVFLSVLLWTDWSNPYVWIASGILFGFGILGAIDDSLKVMRKNHDGLSTRAKFMGQVLLASVGMLTLLSVEPASVSGFLFLPFFKNISLFLGPFLYFVLGIFILVGTSNAVNLTDGLDGLVTGPVMIACVVFAIMSYVSSHAIFSHYLFIPHIPYGGELTVICSALVGAGLGFLWYNAPPAMIMMGDMGALSLGGFLGMISLMIKQECILALVGGIFVMETLSVILQVFVFKRSGRRVFLMAPLHHHFEKKGWAEPTVVFRFWIISILLGLLALSSLKIR